MRPAVVDASDTQFMGYAVSPRLRAGLVSLSLVTNVTPQVPVWMVERSGSATQAVSRARTFVLPDDAPRFGGSNSVDSTLFMRSEERRVEKECVSPCRSGRSPFHYNKKKVLQVNV